MLRRSVIAGNQYCLFAYKPEGAGAFLCTSAFKSLSGLNLCILDYLSEKIIYLSKLSNNFHFILSNTCKTIFKSRTL